MIHFLFGSSRAQRTKFIQFNLKLLGFNMKMCFKVISQERCDTNESDYVKSCYRSTCCRVQRTLVLVRSAHS